MSVKWFRTPTFAQLGLLDTVVIRSESNFPEPVAGEIFLESKRYIIASGGVNVSATMVPPKDGNIEFVPEVIISSPLIYTGTGTMFKNTDAGSLVMLFFRQTIIAADPAAKVFDIIGVGGQVVFTTAVIANCSNLGQIEGLGFTNFFSNYVGNGKGIILRDNSSVTWSRTTVFGGQNLPNTTIIDLQGTQGNIQIASGDITLAGANESFLNLDPTMTSPSERVYLNGFKAGGGSFYASGSRKEKGTNTLILGNEGVQDSRRIGSFVSNGNANVTDVGVSNDWVDLNLSAIAGSNIERWSLTNAVTGELTYNNGSTFAGEVGATIVGESSGATETYQFRVVQNGLPITNSPIGVLASQNQPVTANILAPIISSPGDKCRIQVRNISGTRDITITEMSMIIR